jgi:hypothetical protein
MYNIVLALPVVTVGIFDKDMSEKLILNFNFFYVSGRKRLDLNLKTILLHIAQASVDALIIFFIPYYCYSGSYDVWGNIDDETGKSEGLWVFGTTVYTCLVVSMFFRLALLTNTWTWISHFCFWLSFSFYFLFLIAYQVIYFYCILFYFIISI